MNDDSSSKKHAKYIPKTIPLIRCERTGCIYLELLNMLLPHG